MFGVRSSGKTLLELQWRGMLSDYVTAIAWSPDGETLAASTGSGDVGIWHSGTLEILQSSSSLAVDALAFSRDGQFLAAGGQDGTVKIWQMSAVAGGERSPLHTLNYAPVWIDRLAWSPTTDQLAFNTGRVVQLWDAKVGKVLAELNFAASSVQDLAWHPQGEFLAVAGYQGVKIWDDLNWKDDPYILSIPSATGTIAWSPNGEYLAAANQDATLTVLQWGNPHPWVMQGFPGKLRSLAWSSQTTAQGAPLLAVSSGFTVAVWEKHRDEKQGWTARSLDVHDGFVGTIAFQPGTLLLASGGEDGQILLWERARQLAQMLDSVTTGFSCLSWNRGGDRLAAGGMAGELFIWSKSQRGRGFGAQ